jgi:radical SAM protein with 4Fe4S-binding SPASM domain
MTLFSVDTALSRCARAAETIAVAGAQSSPWRRRLGRAIDWLARGLWHVRRNRRYLSVVKLTNMALINIQSRLRTERVIGMPYRMKIEPTNICNTRCQLCPTGLGLTGRPKGSMPFEEYCRLIDQVKRYLYTLDLSMWGDPLIVPHIYDMIRYAHDRGVWTYLSSNLHAFKPHKGQAEQLIESGLDMLMCSLHGASQQTYEIYQPGKKFDESIRKIEALVKTRHRLDSTTPAVQLNFVVTRHNEHEREQFTRLAENLGCRPIFSSPSLNVRFLDRDQQLVPLGLGEDLLKRKLDEHLENWLPRDQKYVIEPYQQMRDGHFRSEEYNGNKIMNCQWPWKDAVINWDGSVVTCCGVYEPDYDMGNALQRPFHEIWNNRAYRMARRSFRKTVADEPDVANPCRDCPGFLV